MILKTIPGLKPPTQKMSFSYELSHGGEKKSYTSSPAADMAADFSW